MGCKLAPAAKSCVGWVYVRRCAYKHRRLNSDMEAKERGPESYDVKVLGTLNEWRVKMSGRAPAYWDPELHFDALRLVALLREAGWRKPSQHRTRDRFLYAHLRTYTQPTQLFAAGAGMQPTASPLCELA